MPTKDQLQWLEITDMSPGLWDDAAAVARFASPQNAFRTLNDYQPIKGGGLRAFIKPTAIDMSAFGSDIVVVGIYARSGVSRPAGVGGTGFDSFEIIIITMSTSDYKTRICRYDATVASPSWVTLYTTSAGATSLPHQNASFSYFQDGNDVEWYIVTGGGLTDTKKIQLDYTVATGTGNDGAVSSISAHHGPNAVSQGRVFVAGGNALFYSDEFLTTNVDNNNLVVTPDQAESDISIISPVAPSDLTIGKEGGPWVIISGDIANVSTPVREMGTTHTQRQNKQSVPRTPGGFAFIESGGRIFETDGRTFRSLSDSMGNRSFHFTPGMVGPGQMAYLNDIMIAPHADSGSVGRVYDFNVGAWFTTTYLNPVHSVADQNGGFIWCVNHTTGASVLYYYDVFAGARVSTGEIETVPYADANGRNIDILEVQIFAEAFCSTGTEFKIELIDESGNSVVTRYDTIPASRRGLVVGMFPCTKSEYLSVRVTPRSLDGASEAAAIERIRIGFGPNNIVVR